MAPLGTDDRGRDLFARLLYGFRVSVEFALVLTFIGTVIGIFTGATVVYLTLMALKRRTQLLTLVGRS